MTDAEYLEKLDSILNREGSRKISHRQAAVQVNFLDSVFDTEEIFLVLRVTPTYLPIIYDEN